MTYGQNASSFDALRPNTIVFARGNWITFTGSLVNEHVAVTNNSCTMSYFMNIMIELVKV